MERVNVLTVMRQVSISCYETRCDMKGRIRKKKKKGEK